MSDKITHTNPDGSTVLVPSTCKIHRNVMIHEDVEIGDYIEIGRPQYPGDNLPSVTTIRRGTVIRAVSVSDRHDGSMVMKISSNVTIGGRCVISSSIPTGTIIGDRSKIGYYVKIGSNEYVNGVEISPHLIIGDDCEVGDRVIFHRYVTLDSEVHIHDRAEIGENVHLNTLVHIRPGVTIPDDWEIPRGFLVNPHPRQAYGEPPVLVKHHD